MNSTFRALLLVPLLLTFFSCSTVGRFKLPPNTRLQVTDRMVVPNEKGEWETSPFFWSKASGADFRLFDADGKVIRIGKLKMRFRVASIFWPPGGIIYWPMGFAKELYDLTKPSDGIAVRDYGPPIPVQPAAEEVKEEAPPPPPAMKKSTKKKATQQ